MGAEQTVTEPSLVLKLLPDDPPGESGYMNDTRNTPYLHICGSNMLTSRTGQSASFSLRTETRSMIGEELPISPTKLTNRSADPSDGKLSQGSLGERDQTRDESHPRFPKLSVRT